MMPYFYLWLQRASKCVRICDRTNGLRLAGVFALLLLVMGCNDTQKRRELAQSAPLLEQHLTDAYGNDIAFRNTPQRIAALSPNQTEVLFWIGAGDRVVAQSSEAATDGATTDEAAESLPKISIYPSLSLPQLQAYQPDFVLATTQLFPNGDSLRGRLLSLGLPTLVQRYNDLNDTYANIRQLGQLTGNSSGAERAAQQLKRFVDTLDQATDTVNLYQTAILMSLDPLLAIGGKHLLTELTNKAGGNAVFEQQPTELVAIQPDSLLAHGVEVLFLPPGGPNQLNEFVSAHPQLVNLPAVVEKRVFNLNMLSALHPGPGTIRTLIALTAALHPNLNPVGLFQAIEGYTAPQLPD